MSFGEDISAECVCRSEIAGSALVAAAQMFSRVAVPGRMRVPGVPQPPHDTVESFRC